MADSTRADGSHVVVTDDNGSRCKACHKSWGAGTSERDKARQHESDTWEWKP